MNDWQTYQESQPWLKAFGAGQEMYAGSSPQGRAALGTEQSAGGLGYFTNPNAISLRNQQSTAAEELARRKAAADDPLDFARRMVARRQTPTTGGF